MLYLKWTEQDIADLDKFYEIAVLYTALDMDGNVKKEIGINNKGEVVHRAPSKTSRYGIFENQKVILSNDQKKVTKNIFDDLWGIEE